MKTRKLIMPLLMAILSILCLFETADAQSRRRGRDRVVHKRVVVVHRPHRAVVVRRAHVRYAALPRWGAVITTVPSAAVVVHARRNPYYFHNGIFYSRRNTGYVVVRPSPGIRVRVLPAGYRTVVVGPGNYYYYYGTFYTKSNSVDEYIVADAPEGAVVDALPDGYEVKKIDGNEYYELDGVYYAEVDAPEFDDGVGYEVVRL